MHVIDRARPHGRRILPFAQRRRDARHHACRDAADMTGGRTMNMAAENRNDPPGALQDIA
jgi:hypothetical protein